MTGSFRGRSTARTTPKALLFSLTMLLLWSFLSAAAATARDRHFIWSVRGGDGSVTLVGSIHTLKQDAYPLPRPFQEAYEKADHLVFETDIARTAGADVQAQLLAMGLVPEGETLEDRVSTTTYEQLTETLADKGVSPPQVSRFKPWFCALFLVLMETQRLGYNPLYGLDMHYFTKSRKDGKRVSHLEPVDAQIRLLSSLDRHDQEDFLLQSLQEMEILESLFQEMTEAWRTGDADGLHRIQEEGYKDFPELYEKVIVERNRNWLPVIQDILVRGEKDTLVIVGAGHLVGPQGLVAMLRDRGFRVRQR